MSGKTNPQITQYTKQSTQEAADFVAQLSNASASNGNVLDSASAGEFVSQLKIPSNVQSILDSAGGNSTMVLNSILSGVNAYEQMHGCAPSGDVLESAFHQGFNTLDSASNTSFDPIALQPNRAVIAITAAIAEAIPVAHYLPADIGSNRANLIILDHKAGSNFGGYRERDSLDGINSGRSFISASRIHTLTKDANGKFAGKITALQSDSETCVQEAQSVKLLRGCTIIYINGYSAATESQNGNSTTRSPISGNITLGSVEYSITGDVNLDTGVVEVTSSPALPANTKVLAEGFIDYEQNKGLIPLIGTNATSYTLLASPWKVNVTVSTDARTQFANELGVDVTAESLLAVRNQFANERHFQVLDKAVRLAAGRTYPFDFAWNAQGLQKTRTQIMQDFNSVLGVASQVMAEDTQDHGITHLYVGKKMGAVFNSLSRDIFEPSGVSPRAGIYRIGRFLGLYDVYYNPKAVEGDSTSKIVCIGRATQVARNPFVLGDAVAPMIIPLSTDKNHDSSTGFYARNFTSVNPHKPSASGCAVIDVINLS